MNPERQTISPIAGGPVPDPSELVGLGILSVSANVGLMLVKILAGVFGHSQALIADGVESAADVLTSLFTWTGFRLSLRPADDNHPFGHGKIEPLVGAISGGCLVVAAGFIAVSSIAEIGNPGPRPAAFTLPVLFGIILVKEFIGRRIFAAAANAGSTALEGEAWHHRSDAVTSAAAAIGIALSLYGGVRFGSADDWAALVACVIILFNGVRIIGRSIHDLLDGNVAESVEDGIRARGENVDGVENIEKCRVRKSGVRLFVELHIRVDSEITVADGHRIAHEVKDELMRIEPRIADVVVHVEPAEFRDAAHTVPD
jgi:cation diffusion facilitator family transporter